MRFVMDINMKMAIKKLLYIPCPILRYALMRPENFAMAFGQANSAHIKISNTATQPQLKTMYTVTFVVY